MSRPRQPSLAMARSSLLAVGLLAVACVALLQSLAFAGAGAPQLRAQRPLSPVLLRATATPETMEKIADVVAEQLGVDKAKVVGSATLSELGADSLDIVETVMALEESFDIELPDEETTQLKNLQDVGDLIQSKL
ncbi:unnamed protein product [Prorocentrum cordatum]|uniref:Acyl carrier protein n=1 Tax=Prorocentrum cordatum TaxID=2364126 RepID=A0ABN9X8A0_9DINO|nr:unnamed protein product [Polarella glacialis]